MSTLIEPGHLFSQHSLNTFLRCPRRFLLKYVEQQPWPVPETEEPAEYMEHLARGRVLHQWLARDHLGLDMEPIARACGDPLLWSWWQAAQQFDRERLPREIREAELPVVVPLGDYRLYARYDLLALTPGDEAVIVDWKTLEALPSMRTLTGRAQTRVYLYTLVKAGWVLTGGPPIEPEHASMLYWFANFPEDEALVRYSRATYERDARELLELVEKISALAKEEFRCTDNLRLCRTCNYRSLCGRESEARTDGDLTWLDEDIDFELELDELEELEY